MKTTILSWQAIGICLVMIACIYASFAIELDAIFSSQLLASSIIIGLAILQKHLNEKQ